MEKSSSPYQSIIDSTLSEIEARRRAQGSYQDALAFLREQYKAAIRLPQVLWSAFCLQWVAISWCAVIGRDQ